MGLVEKEQAIRTIPLYLERKKMVKVIVGANGEGFAEGGNNGVDESWFANDG